MDLDFGKSNALRTQGVEPFKSARGGNALGGDVVALEDEIAVIGLDVVDGRFYFGLGRIARN